MNPHSHCCERTYIAPLARNSTSGLIETAPVPACHLHAAVRPSPAPLPAKLSALARWPQSSHSTGGSRHGPEGCPHRYVAACGWSLSYRVCRV